MEWVRGLVFQGKALGGGWLMASDARRLLVLALLVEGVLGGSALAWARLRGGAIELGAVLPGLAFGLVYAGFLVFVNYCLLRVLPPTKPVQAVRSFYRGVVQPLFREATALDILGISLAAGIGEELLFRGALQSEFGIVLASVAFGLAHVGGRESIAFGLWVFVLGIGLGVLVPLTGGILAAVVAHVIYDAAAMSYMRYDLAGDVRRQQNARACNADGDDIGNRAWLSEGEDGA